MSRMRRVIALVAVFLGLVAAIPLPASALVISFVDTGGAGPGTDMERAFKSAAGFWSSRFSDPVTLKFDVGFVNLGAGKENIIADAPPVAIDIPYAVVRDALVNDKRTADDFLAVAGLQAGPAIEFFTTDKNGNRIKDTDGTTNNTVLHINRPNAKALGLLGVDGASDGTLRFNTAFAASLDFDRSDGIAAGKLDLVGVITHEIGHQLGFISGVDWVDSLSLPNGPNAPFDMNGTATFSVLDLYRYTQASAADGHLLDLAVGGEPYFSLDTGVTSLGRFSNGSYNGTGGTPNGNGSQASHWLDLTPTIGLMDPIVEFGREVNLSLLDVRAFDVIGWDRVPEPSVLFLLAIGFGAVRLARKIRPGSLQCGS